MTTKKSKTKKRRRSFIAWAIFDGDELACWDYRLPLTWHRWTAKEDAKRYCSEDDVIRKVRITVED